jgi:hypothetical protein
LKLKAIIKKEFCGIALGKVENNHYTVTRPNAGFRQPDRTASESSVRGDKIFPLVGPGAYTPKLRTFPVVTELSDGYGIFQRFPCEKKTVYPQGGIKLAPSPISLDQGYLVNKNKI